MNTSTNAGRHSAGSATGGVALKARGGQLAPAGNKPTTGGPAMKRPAKIGGGTTAYDGSTGQAEQQMSAAPVPFQNPRGGPQLPAPANNRAMYGIGSGASKNTASISGSKPPKHPPTGPTGGYKPKKNHGPSGLSKFYGG